MCAKEFDKYALRNHIRSHTKEKPFMCQICKRGFSLSTNLKRHVITHTGERPYVCNVRQKGFIQLTSLAAHLKTHSEGRENEKGDIVPKEVPQYSCIHYGRSFLRLTCYNKHVLQHQIPLKQHEETLSRTLSYVNIVMLLVVKIECYAK